METGKLNESFGRRPTRKGFHWGGGLFVALMKTIWKYTLEITDRQMLMIPKGAEFLTCQMQNGQPCLWALVESGLAEKRMIQIVGTGRSFDSTNRTYIGTVQDVVNGLVWHIFEVK